MFDRPIKSPAVPIDAGGTAGDGTYIISVGGSGGGSGGGTTWGLSGSGKNPFVTDIQGTSIGAITSTPVEPIKGKMITVNLVYTGADIERLGLSSVPNYFEDTIKKDLIMKLAHSLARENYVEFTKQEDFASNSITYRARIYATPDDKVRILRKEGVK